MNQNAPGRHCPLHYRYTPRALRSLDAISANVIYVVGGLYGNVEALNALNRLLDQESDRPMVVFNGDFHWFDIDPASFSLVNDAALSHIALRGNVETELAGEDDPAGCGCAYPDDVNDGEVERSNRIIATLRETARAFPHARAVLDSLPMYAVAQVGRLRVGIVHGDAESLAGWQFSHGALSDHDSADRCARWFEQAGVQVFASSHTCLPVWKSFLVAGRRMAVVNNGAAGMPNFAGTRYGLVTRIGLTPAPAGAALYGDVIDGAHVDAVRLDYDHVAWMKRFLGNWPAGSDAHLSYHERIDYGPRFSVPQARIAV
ncbi:MAG: metallophosphoesterase family protein [Burkholderiales bacterium]